MTAYLVSPDGDDTTGDGSYAAPFKTIARAATEAGTTPVDVIEVAAGAITETVAIDGPLGFRAIRGRGAASTTIAVDLSGAWISLDSTDGDRLLISHALVTTLTDDATLIAVNATDDVVGGVAFARCRLTLSGDSIAIAYAGPDPQTYVPVFTADLLHCLVEGPENDVGGVAFSGVGSPIGSIAARNCIFRRLLAANAAGTQPADTDGCFFFENERDLTLGQHGTSDVRAVDPELVDETIEPSTDSPLVDAGVDLREGYGTPTRTPAEEVGLTFPGSFPTVGVVEPVAPQGRTVATATNIHLIVAAESTQTGAWRDDLDAIGLARSLRTASGADLTRRWGSLVGLLNIDGNTAEYRRDLTDALAAILEHAPSWHTLRELARIIYGDARLIRVDDNRRYHFQAGTKLKLWADHTAGPTTFDFYLTAGEVMLEGRWLRVFRNNFTASAADATLTVYTEGVDAFDDPNNTAKVFVSDSEIEDETRSVLGSVHYTFRKGETLVTANADLPSGIQPHRRITTGFSNSDFVIESIVDDRSFELRYPFPEDDHVGKAILITPNIVYGKVFVDATFGIVDILCPGRLGRTTRAYSRATKAHGYELTLDANGSALQDATVATRALFGMLGRAHPVHKRGYFRLRDDGDRALVLGQPWPYEPQSSVDYTELFDDPAWFGP